MNIVYLVSMHCAACKSTVEKALSSLNGVSNFSINLINNTIDVTFDESLINEEIIKKTIENSGFRVSKYEEENVKDYLAKERRNNIIKIIIGIIVLIPLMFFGMSPMYSNIFPETFKVDLIYLNGYIQLFLTLILVGLFFNFYISGAKALFKGHPDMNTLVFLSSLASILYSIYLTVDVTINKNNYHFSHLHYFYDGSGMVLVVVSIGRLIESLSKKKAQDTINKLLELRPKVAHVIRDNVTYEVESKYLQKGDIILVKAGENIPVDGLIISGKSYIDESMLTGESELVSKGEDDEVFAGTINKDGSLNIIVNKNNKDSLLNHIIDLVNKASNMKSNLTRMVDKVASIFVPVVLILAVVVFTIWMFVDYFALNGSTLLEMNGMKMYSSPIQEALSFAISVLSISCPCALGLATPISLLVGSSVFSSNGVLVNESSAIEKISNCNAIVLDKTNTLTEGKLKVDEYIKYEGYRSEFDEIVYSLEKSSNHPFSLAIENYFSNLNRIIDIKEVSNISGKGVSCIYKDEKYYVGSLALVSEICSKEEIKKIDESKISGHLIAFFFTKDKLFSYFLLSDTLSSTSLEFINKAKKKFSLVSLCTGDNKNNANKVASILGISEVISNVTPIKKKEYVEELINKGYKVIMVGDGINDSIALTLADVSIGLAKGSDIAMASSDFILMKSDLNSIFMIIDFSLHIKNNIKFNLFWAFIYNIIFIPVASGAFAYFGFYLDPMYCSLLMVISSITVCLNSLLLFRFNNKYKKVK